MPFEIYDSSADDFDDSLNAAGSDDARVADESLIHDDSAWPEELSLLGSQLSADAARLATLYPLREVTGNPLRASTAATSKIDDLANVTTGSAPSHRFLARFAAGRSLRWIAAAAVVAVASLATRYADRSQPPSVIADPDATPAVQIAAKTDAGAAAPQDASQGFEESGFENLSSPAQEALLDLFEDDQLAQASLSI